MSYAWKPGFRSNGVSADDAFAEVDQIRAATDGVDVPRHIVEAARDPNSPLHPIFEWDDAEAAERQRLHHARLLLGSIVRINVTVQGSPPPTRAFVRVKANVEIDGEIHRRTVVVETATAMSDEGQRQQILKRAKREMHEWAARYQSYVWLAEQVTKAESVVKALSEMVV